MANSVARCEGHKLKGRSVVDYRVVQFASQTAFAIGQGGFGKLNRQYMGT